MTQRLMPNLRKLLLTCKLEVTFAHKSHFVPVAARENNEICASVIW